MCLPIVNIIVANIAQSLERRCCDERIFLEIGSGIITDRFWLISHGRYTILQSIGNSTFTTHALYLAVNLTGDNTLITRAIVESLRSLVLLGGHQLRTRCFLVKII